MKTGQCPKCASRDVIRISDRNEGILSNRYLCGNCGYIESWIENPDELAKLSRYYRLEEEKQLKKK